MFSFVDSFLLFMRINEKFTYWKCLYLHQSDWNNPFWDRKHTNYLRGNKIVCFILFFVFMESDSEQIIALLNFFNQIVVFGIKMKFCFSWLITTYKYQYRSNIAKQNRNIKTKISAYFFKPFIWINKQKNRSRRNKHILSLMLSSSFIHPKSTNHKSHPQQSRVVVFVLFWM